MTDGIVERVMANAGIAAPTKDPFDEWVDEPLTELSPGFHWDGQHAWIVTPGVRRVTRTVGKGKNAVEAEEEVPHLMAIRDDRVATWYDKDSLAPYHLRPNSYAVHKVKEPRWSFASAKAFVKQGTQPRTIRSLYEELHEVYKTYVEYADLAHYELMPLFILQTYVYSLWSATGYIHFNGTAGAGKTRNMDLIRLLGFNATSMSSTTPSALFRLSEGLRGVLCVDEMESFKGDDKQELRSILLGGYTSQGTAIRNEKGSDDNWTPYSFTSFVPKAIASINPLDDVLGSRSIVIPMVPALNPPSELDMDSPAWRALRDDLHVWALTHAKQVATATRLWNKSLRFTLAPGLVNRSWQISQPYLTLAHLIDEEGLLPRITAFFDEYTAVQRQALDSTDRARLTLRCLPRVFATQHPRDDGRYSVASIYAVVVNYLDADQQEWFKSSSVRRLLEVLGFKDKTVKSGGIGYRLDQDEVRQMMRHRRIQPFEEDIHWFESGDDHVPPPHGYGRPDLEREEQEAIAWGG